MTEKDPGPRPVDKKAARAARQAAALRENLRRRKEQTRARAPGEEADETASPEEAD